MERKPTPSFVETIAVPAAAAAGVGGSASSAADISQITSSSAADEGRYLPGALLGGRYRIIGLLGRGGMGEVYRATDLALGQAVALKFLPDEASRNPRLLERFHGEVRVARLVSHPNVCRVFDIGTVEGAPFISMEYVDGEDLASLLTRIGRLPSDKALAAARQLCAGLAAAHDRGVIHRDLKPQNIMINKRGDVVIMDFGLAAIADQLSGAEARNGTPAYMAPEQLRGSGVTQASDIYAVGLVLYELFTGKRPYEAKTLKHLIDLQESAQLTSMTSVAADIDPAVEKVIRRCLDPDPLKRPAGALPVAAALPGGDPLAAALAAGETPSPEVVANAGSAEGMARKYSIPCLLIVAASLFGSTWFFARNHAATRAPLENPPEVLAHIARGMAASFGYPARPADSAVWIEHRGELVQYLNRIAGPKRFDEWLAAEAPIRAVYRESPQPLLAEPAGRVDAGHPPMVTPRMVTVAVDGHGRLLRFIAVPGEGETSPPIAPEEVFRAARLDPATFHEIPPTLVPEHASDTIRAWQGRHPQLPETPLTVQVAWWRGRVSEANVTYPYQTSARANPAQASGFVKSRELSNLIVPVIGAFFAALFARRNWKLGRTDRKGAFRVAAARFLLGMVVWAGRVHPVPTEDMLGFLVNAASDLIGSTVLLWLVYLAIEPAVRARYPHSIVTWNRLLAGRWLDAQVAADVLIGGAVGCALWISAKLLTDLGLNRLLVSHNLWAILGTRSWIGGHAGALSGSLYLGLMVFATMCFLRGLMRNDILAALATAVVFTLTQSELGRSSDWMVLAALFIIVYTILAFVLVRIGLVATISTIFFIDCFNSIWLGADWKAWCAPAGIASIALMLSIALVAFWKSLGSRGLLAGEETLN